MLLPVSLWAQQGRVIVLENADALEGKVIDGEEVREFTGNVRISQEQVRIRCDRAVQFLGSARIVMTGNVRVHDDSMTITAPRGIYYTGVRRAEAFERVTLDDGTSRLEADYGVYDVDPRTAFFRSRVVAFDTGSVMNADSIRYDRTRKFMHAMGAVVIYNKADAMTISGGDFEHDGMTGFSRMTLDPVLIKVDTAGAAMPDTLVVRSLVMEAYQDSTRRLVARDSVEIARKDLAGRAGTVRFFLNGDSIQFHQSPILWYQETQVTGDSITVFLRTRSLEQIVVLGNAFAASRSDSAFPERLDQMAGETMFIRFAARKLQRIDLDTRAVSLYHLYEDSVANGLNKTSGDRIAMMFEAGRAQSIRVAGGVEGQYFPENMVERREKDYSLPGLRWRTDRPVMRATDVSRARTLRIPLPGMPSEPARPGVSRTLRIPLPGMPIKPAQPDVSRTLRIPTPGMPIEPARPGVSRARTLPIQ
jgi:lipopolysaccharide export system protein LptA